MSEPVGENAVHPSLHDGGHVHPVHRELEQHQVGTHQLLLLRADVGGQVAPLAGGVCFIQVAEGLFGEYPI